MSRSVPLRTDAVLAKSINFEVTVADLARKSERRAWIVALAAVSMSVILAGGYFYFLPLKEKVPFLVMADAYWRSKTGGPPASTRSIASALKPMSSSWRT